MDRREWITIVLLAFLFGGSFFFTEIANEDVGPFTIAASRLVIGAVVLIAILHFVRVDGDRLPTLRQMALLGLFNSFIPITLIAVAQRDLASGVAAILAATSPIVGAIFAHFFSPGERLTLLRALGTSIAFVGVILIIGPGTLMNTDIALAPFAVLLAAMSSAAAGVFGRRVVAGDVAPLSAATGQVVSAATIATIFALVVEQPWTRPYPGLSSVAALIVMGVLSTGLAYLLFFRLLAKVGAANTLMVGFLVPVCATLLGVTLLEERLDWTELCGLFLVLVSLLIINRSARGRGVERRPEG
jgi:drug/metabolite transporter (DMT)-like permease